MASFDAGDIVAVPFPYTDRPVRQRRPALVVSAAEIEAEHGLAWVVMITSAENRGWRGDIPISALAKAGLPVPSVIRTRKIATIETRDARRLGEISAEMLARVIAEVRSVLDA